MQSFYRTPKSYHLMFGLPFSARTPIQLLTQPSFYTVRFNDDDSFFIGNHFHIPFEPPVEPFALTLGPVTEESLAEMPRDRLSTLCYGPVTDLSLGQASTLCPTLPMHWTSRDSYRHVLEATLNHYDLSPYQFASKLYGRLGQIGRRDSLIETVVGDSVTDWEDRQQFAGKRLIDLLGFYLIVEPTRDVPITDTFRMPIEIDPKHTRVCGR